MFPIVTLFGKDIGTYSLCVIAGILALMLCTWLLARRRGLAPDDEVIVMLVALAGMAVGGSLLYGATNAPLVAEIVRSYAAYDGFAAWVADLAACFGGSVFYGGLVGAVAAGCLFVRARGGRVLDHVDVFAVGIPLFHAIGRLGCFLGGCCFGVEWSGGVVYAHSPIAFANGVPRFPVQLVEAGVELALFLVLLGLFLRGRGRGRLMAYWALAYAPARFLLEFLRGDAYRGFLGPLSTSQWISIAVFLAAVAFLAWSRRRGGARATARGGGAGRGRRPRSRARGSRHACPRR